MNFRPIAGIDVGKFFSEMAILSPSNEVIARMKIRHDSSTDVERAVELLKKRKRTLILAFRRHGIHWALSQNPFPFTL